MRRADMGAAVCRHPRVRGFTLVEVLVVMAIVALLATFAWPSFQAQWLRSRRADAQLALMQLQHLQARWRADHPGYASATELGAPASSPQGHYRLAVQEPSAVGYLLLAEAQAGQRADTACAVLALRLEQAHTAMVSRTAAGAENTDAANRRCWGR